MPLSADGAKETTLFTLEASARTHGNGEPRPRGPSSRGRCPALTIGQLAEHLEAGMAHDTVLRGLVGGFLEPGWPGSSVGGCSSTFYECLQLPEAEIFRRATTDSHLHLPGPR